MGSSCPKPRPQALFRLWKVHRRRNREVGKGGEVRGHQGGVIRAIRPNISVTSVPRMAAITELHLRGSRLKARRLLVIRTSSRDDLRPGWTHKRHWTDWIRERQIVEPRLHSFAFDVCFADHAAPFLIFLAHECREFGATLMHRIEPLHN